MFTVDPGGLRRLNLGGWTTLMAASALPSNAVLLDLAGVSPADIWAAGTKGLVVHWHE